MKVCVLLDDIPFSRDAALALCARLGVEGYERDASASEFDPSPVSCVPDWMQRRKALLDALEENGCPDVAYFCDADESGRPTALGEGLNDLDAYVRALCAMGFDGRAVIKNVRGTDALEKSAAYLKEKLSAYARR